MAAFALARHEHRCFRKTPFISAGFHDKSWPSEQADEFSGLHSDANCTSKKGKELGISTPYPGWPRNTKVIPSGAVDEFFTKEVKAELYQQYMSTKKSEVDTSCQVAM